VVLSTRDLGRSVSHPRFSPDGKFLLCSITNFGNFPAFSPDADLYMLDPQTGRGEYIAANSDQSDGFHSWSSNGRWIAFSSKRRDGLFARPHFSHVDGNGKTTKPFMLPQEDPFFYDSYIRIYNLPELLKEPVRVSERTLAEAIHDPARTMQAVLDPAVTPQEQPEETPQQMRRYVE